MLGLFHSEPGNGSWKRKVDAAFQYCTVYILSSRSLCVSTSMYILLSLNYVYVITLQSVKALFDESLVAIPDSVLDATIGLKSPSSSGCIDTFANSKRLLPLPPVSVWEDEVMYA